MHNSNCQLLVSIIVPVFNVAPYLRRCVDSILTQTYHNLEIILVDDGSTDDSPQICDLYQMQDSRVKVIHKCNGGLSDARNVGVDNCHGHFITFIDSDDWYANDAIEKLLNCATDLNTDITCMYNISSTQNGPTEPDRHTDLTTNVFSSTAFAKLLCEKKVSTSVCNKLFQSRCFQTLRFVVDRLNEDFRFLGELLLESCTVGVLEYTGYFYFQRNGSLTHSGKRVIRPVMDAMQNALELKNMARTKCPELEASFARMALYQARTLLIIVPSKELNLFEPLYNTIMQCLIECWPFWLQANLNWKDRVILFLFRWWPALAVRLTHIH